jgi:capsule polysaccharide export protein KpsE/RkpR
MTGSSVAEVRDQETTQQVFGHPTHWAVRAMLLWRYRRLLGGITTSVLILSLSVVFLLPKEYTAETSIMPPDQQGSGAMVLAALSGHAGGLGALGSLAGGLLGEHPSTALFINLLESGTVGSHLINRFDLKRVYHTRYNINAAKHLARVTKITDDKKSGVITIKVQDEDPVRARDMAQAYLDELNRLVTQTSTSTAHQERVFIESRLHSVEGDLERAQLELSEFSSKNSTIDIREQTHAMVDAGARVQAELLVEQSGLQSLRQIYGDSNMRVRETEARIASLQHDLRNMTGSSAPLPTTESGTSGVPSASHDEGALYPPLRQLPRLAVPYADLYRRVKVQEAVFELLTQQYEMARIEEAKDIPSVRVIDPPGIPERKSGPPRRLLTLFFTLMAFVTTAWWIIVREYWVSVDANDPRKRLVDQVLLAAPKWVKSLVRSHRYMA